MTPGRINFTCPQGSTFSRHLVYKIDDVPVNLTGYSARMQVRELHDSDQYLIYLQENSGITLGGSAGTIDILIDDTITADFITGDHVYDLEVESSSGITDRLIEGRFLVTPEVTR